MSEARRPRPWLLVACYLPGCGIFPLLLDRSSREERWHARNGLLLLAGFLAVVGLAALAGFLVPSLGCLSGILFFVLGVIYAVVLILAIVKALQGARLMVPGLSGHADR